MGFPGIDLEFMEGVRTQRIMGQHLLDGSQNGFFGTLCQKFAFGNRLNTARIPRVAENRFRRFVGSSIDSAFLQWNGNNYFGSLSKQILSNSQILTIDFTGAVQAYGLDASNFTGFGNNMTVSTFAADDSTLLFTSAVFNPPNGEGTFYGFQNAGGIGSVVLTSINQPWSPIIDDLTFGTISGSAAPEPATLALLTLGIVGGMATQRRK